MSELQQGDTPGTDAAWGGHDPLWRLSDNGRREFCAELERKIQRLREVNQKLIEALKRIATSSMREDGSYSTNVGNIEAAREVLNSLEVQSREGGKESR